MDYRFIKRAMLFLASLGMAFGGLGTAYAQDMVARSISTQAKTSAQAADTKATVAQLRVAQNRSIISGPNLFNPLDQDVRLGYYIFTNGNLLANSGHNVSGFIPVDAGQSYYLGYYAAPTRNILGLSSHMATWYDANKNFISQQSSIPSNVTAPDNAAYLRVSGSSVTKQNWSTITVTAGASAPSNWSTFQPPFIPSAYQTVTLRQTHMRLTKLSLPTPEATQLIINAPGDSYTHGANRWVTPLTDYLSARYGDAGGGWTSFGAANATATPPWNTGNQPNNVNGNARPALYPVRFYGAISFTYFTQAIADLASATLTASGDAIEADFPASPTISGIDLHYIGTGSCSIRYGYGATQGALPSSWNTLALNAATDVTTVVALSTSGIAQPGTLRVEYVSGTCKLGGVNFKSTANGVRVNKIAATGSAVAQYTAVNGTNWQTSFSALGGHLTIYMTGANDQSSAIPGPGGGTYVANMSSLVNRFRGATTGAPTSTAMDVMIVMPPENQRSNNTYAIAAYSSVVRTLAYQARFAFVDTQMAFGDAGNPANYGSAGDVPLFQSDLLHPDALTGGRLMMSEIMRPLMPW